MRLALKSASAVVFAVIGGCGEPCEDPAPILTAASLAEPQNDAFVGRAWISTSAGPERGSILVFLPDGVLLVDACPVPLRISQWGVAGNHIRWLEDTVPIEAEVSMPGQNELRLRIIGKERPESYIAATPPYVCPSRVD